VLAEPVTSSSAPAAAAVAAAAAAAAAAGRLQLKEFAITAAFDVPSTICG